VDPLGDVAVVSDLGSGTVVADTLTGTPTQSTIASGLPVGTNITVALDRSGNVFISSITKVLEVVGGITLPAGEPGGGSTSPSGTATPELGSGELMATGILPILGALLYRRRRGRRRVQEQDEDGHDMRD
jgi:hypothetical protein